MQKVQNVPPSDPLTALHANNEIDIQPCIDSQLADMLMDAYWENTCGLPSETNAYCMQKLQIGPPSDPLPALYANNAIDTSPCIDSQLADMLMDAYWADICCISARSSIVKHSGQDVGIRVHNIHERRRLHDICRDFCKTRTVKTWMKKSRIFRCGNSNSV